MITSRFNKDEAALQKDYIMGKFKKKRLMVFSALIGVAVALYLVMVFAIGPVLGFPYKLDPLYMPLFPSVLSFLIIYAVALGLGAYYKKKLFDMSDVEERPVVRTSYLRTAMMYIIVFLIIIVIVAPMVSFIAPDTNYYESISKTESSGTVDTVLNNSFLKIEYDGTDNLGTVRTEVSVSSNNNVPLDFYLMLKSDGDQYTNNNTNIDFSRAVATSTAALSFKHSGASLDARKYVLLILDNNQDAASVHYLVIQKTSDDLTLVIFVFFIAYIGMVAGWYAYARNLGKAVAPAPVGPPGRPLPTREPTGAEYRPGTPETSAAAGYRPGAPERPAGAAPAARPLPPQGVQGGVKMSITCPKCSAAFDVYKGPDALRIRCPSCGKEGTLGASAPPTGPAAPAPAAPAPAPTLPSPAAPPAPAAPAPALPAAAPLPPAVVTSPAAPAATAAPAGPVPKRNIACPRCKTQFPIDAIEGPQQIKCPSCGKEGTIGKKPGAPAAPAATSATAPAVPAPTPVPAPLPPAVITAPSPATAPAPAMAIPGIRTPGPAPQPSPASPGGGKMIACPACRKPFAVMDPTRPIKVKCPSCGKEGTLRK